MITAQQLYDLSVQYDNICSESVKKGCEVCVFTSRDFCSDHCPEFSFKSVEQAQKFLDFVGYVEVSSDIELAEILPYEQRSEFHNYNFTDVKIYA